VHPRETEGGDTAHDEGRNTMSDQPCKGYGLLDSRDGVVHCPGCAERDRLEGELAEAKSDARSYHAERDTLLDCCDTLRAQLRQVEAEATGLRSQIDRLANERDTAISNLSGSGRLSGVVA
jgi:hypothetical protein